MANGTITIEVALRAAGVGWGDEVIVPAYTFQAAATAAIAASAIPVLADIDPETYCLLPLAIEHRITPRTRATGIQFDSPPHPQLTPLNPRSTWEASAWHAPWPTSGANLMQFEDSSRPAAIDGTRWKRTWQRTSNTSWRALPSSDC